MLNRCRLVKQTCGWVTERAKHVKIDHKNLSKLADQIIFRTFNEEIFHQAKKQPQQALLQMFMLDCMNFCFWPLQGFEYQHLATHIQLSVNEGITLQQLSIITEEGVISRVFHKISIPMAEERARIFREMANTILFRFGGSFVALVESAKKSAVNLLNILTQNFPNFQDHSIYKGHQIHFYKRGQILISDIYGKFNGAGLGQFHDISELTMFPDYRVPQILEYEQVFCYSQYLREIIHEKRQITDRELEIELRASTIAVVEAMKAHLHQKGRTEILSIQIDWFLWQRGQMLLEKLPPHHRCLTIYY